MGEVKVDMKKHHTTMDEKIQALEARVVEAEDRVKEIGTSSAELIDDAYGHMDKMETWHYDQDGRSHRNNIRVHGLVEGAEHGNITSFMERFPEGQ